MNKGGDQGPEEPLPSLSNEDASCGLKTFIPNHVLCIGLFFLFFFFPPSGLGG